LKVTVKPYLFLQEALGVKELTLDLSAGTDIYELLKIIRGQYGLPDRIEADYGNITLFEDDQPVALTILIDGRNIKQLQGIATVLKDGSVVALFPPAAGG
jgi:sulfur-carrier protein